MRRKNGNGLVKNEQVILAALMDEAQEPHHGYALAKKFPGMAVSTLYRCFDRLADMGYLTFEWEQDPSDHQGPPRKQFRLTPMGRKHARELSEA